MLNFKSLSEGETLVKRKHIKIITVFEIFPDHRPRFQPLRELTTQMNCRKSAVLLGTRLANKIKKCHVDKTGFN